MAHAYGMTDAAMKMPSAAMESSAPDHSMDCGGNDKAAHAACVAMCATAVAILSEPAAIPFVVAMQKIVAPTELPPPAAPRLPNRILPNAERRLAPGA